MVPGAEQKDQQGMMPESVRPDHGKIFGVYIKKGSKPFKRSEDRHNTIKKKKYIYIYMVVIWSLSRV